MARGLHDRLIREPTVAPTRVQQAAAGRLAPQCLPPLAGPLTRKERRRLLLAGDHRTELLAAVSPRVGVLGVWSGQTRDVTNRKESAEAEDGRGGWLVLIYRIPSEPTRLRAAVWRRLKGLGAIYLQNSAAALPASRSAERALRRLRHEIVQMSGTAVLMSCSVLLGEGDVRGAFQAARDDEYEEIVDRCEDFLAGIEKEFPAAHFSFAELEENEVDHVKLANWLAKVIERDVFGAPGRAAADQRSLREVIHRQRREREREPRQPNRPSAEVPHVGVERFGASDRQHNSPHGDERPERIVEHEGTGVGRRQGTQNSGPRDNVRQTGHGQHGSIACISA
jgi:hypothetical protein